MLAGSTFFCHIGDTLTLLPVPSSGGRVATVAAFVASPRGGGQGGQGGGEVFHR